GTSYGERVRRFSQHDGHDHTPRPSDVLMEFAEAGSLALRHLAAMTDQRELAAAVDLSDQADTVWVVGFRRSFPVAAYLAYSLQQTQKRTVLIDGVAGFGALGAKAMGPKDVLIAISFQPYAPETLEVYQIAVA